MFIVNNNRIFALIAYHKQLYQNHQNTFVTRYTNNIWHWRLAWMGLSEVPPSSLVSSIQYIWNPMSEGKPVTCTGWQLVLHKTNIKAYIVVWNPIIWEGTNFTRDACIMQVCIGSMAQKDTCLDTSIWQRSDLYSSIVHVRYVFW